VTDLPPVLYLPCAAGVVDPAEARPELRRTRDGRLALLAYTALDRLRACCGADQPWVLVRTQALDAIDAADHYDLLLLDVVVPEQHRGARPAPAAASVIGRHSS
jgi:hypothetical protein